MKKKIVFYGAKSYPSQGGSDRAAENLMRHLKDRFDMHIYCFKDPLAKNYMEGVEVTEFTRWFRGSLGVFIYFLQSGLHLLFERKVDLVHAHKTDCALFIPMLRLRFPVVATSQEAPYVRDKWNWFIKMYFRLVEWFFIQSPNASTCISKPLTDYYKQRYGKPVVFIPNAINATAPEVYTAKSALPKLPSSVNVDAPFILFSARRLMATKGCHTMLLALHQVGYKGQIFIASELDEGDKYLQSLRRMAVGLDVHFLGFINPLSAVLALVHRAELFIFPSETEGMSLMLLEVASVGKPIIASDIPENKQVFNSEEVLYFRAKDEHDLADKIKFALENKTAMAKFGQSCQRRVFADYQWEKISKIYEGVYNSVIQ
jgi:glycosyltransferase involved in cell wall biosynthesis